MSHFRNITEAEKGLWRGILWIIMVLLSIAFLFAYSNHHGNTNQLEKTTDILCQFYRRDSYRKGPKSAQAATWYLVAEDGQTYFFYPEDVRADYDTLREIIGQNPKGVSADIFYHNETQILFGIHLNKSTSRRVNRLIIDGETLVENREEKTGVTDTIEVILLGVLVLFIFLLPGIMPIRSYIKSRK